MAELPIITLEIWQKGPSISNLFGGPMPYVIYDHNITIEKWNININMEVEI